MPINGCGGFAFELLAGRQYQAQDVLVEFPQETIKALYLFEIQRLVLLLCTQSRIAHSIINTYRKSPNLIDNQPITQYQL